MLETCSHTSKLLMLLLDDKNYVFLDHFKSIIRFGK